MNLNLDKLAHLEDVSLNLDAMHPDTGEKVKEVFCGAWPTSRKTLELMVETVKNPLVKIIIKMVITIGEGISAKVCK